MKLVYSSCPPAANAVSRTQREIATSDLIESMLPGLLLALISAGLVLLPAWAWVLRAACRQMPVWQGDVLMVCGHRLEQGRPSPDYRCRLRAAAELAEDNPGLDLLLLGGGQPSEAAAGRNWLLEHSGVSAARIRLEEDSVDSLENLCHARELVAPYRDPGLLSSRYHLGRLSVLTGQAGLAVTLIPAEPRPSLTPQQLRATLLEAIYLIWFLTGRGWARLARRRRLLAQLGE